MTANRLPTGTAGDLLSDALSRGGTQAVSLQFDDKALNTTVMLAGTQICGVQSRFVPQWSASLAHGGVTSEMLDAARIGAQTPQHLVRNLMSSGHLSEEKLAELLQLRTKMAFVPIVLQSATAQSSPQAPASWISQVDGPALVRDAEASARQLSDDALSIKPTDQLEVMPQLNTSEGHSADEVLRQGAIDGLTLAESARRSHLSWDVVAQEAAGLIQRGVARIVSPNGTYPVRHLKPGDQAPDFLLPSLQGPPVALSQFRGKRVWLMMHRMSNCTHCNPHHRTVMQVQAQMESAGVAIVEVWATTVEKLHRTVGRTRPTFPVLCDETASIHRQYGLDRSLKRLIDLRNYDMIKEGFKMMGPRGWISEGQMFLVPAEFLINEDGQIEAAHYNEYMADFLTVDTVLQWARRSS
ncbi:redoxin domain-containing protein [Deinococcus aquaedulcis]|uniref:redoxin domain-containing protein n=1 Tax=Deinococcus aquaedulcis TaxID=2840455 RepID=UPI001C8404C1|nr:redoxin domain-containing protein [Deinococcus aquaedulcis]